MIQAKVEPLASPQEAGEEQVGCNGSPPEWVALVHDGRVAAKDYAKDKWRLGDLALEVEAMGSHGGLPTGAEERLNLYAAEIGVPFKTLREYRWVAWQWPPESRRPDSSFSVHQDLAGLDDRHDVIHKRAGWTSRSAREYVASRRPRSEDPDFEDIEIDELLPADGRCSLCGTENAEWPRLERKVTT